MTGVDLLASLLGSAGVHAVAGVPALVDDVALANAAMVWLALVFAWAGVVKLHDRDAFAANVVGLAPRLRVRAPAVAVAIPALELCAAVCLTGVAARTGAVLAAALLMVSTVVVALGRSRLATVGCGCLWPDGGRSRLAPVLVRNAVLLFAALAVFAQHEPMAWNVPAAMAGIALLFSLLLLDAHANTVDAFTSEPEGRHAH